MRRLYAETVLSSHEIKLDVTFIKKLRTNGILLLNLQKGNSLKYIIQFNERKNTAAII